MEKIVIIGYGGHARSIIDSIRSAQKYEIVGYTDVRDKEGDILFLGEDKELVNIFSSGVHNAFFGIGFMGQGNLRDQLYSFAKDIGFSFPKIIDTSAVVANDANICEGTFIGKRAVVNAGSQIGKMCIINTGAIIEHEGRIGDYTHIAVGATLCGDVKVGDHSLIGANSTVIQGITIGSNVIVGAGAVVTKDIIKNQTVVGIPAQPAIKR